MITSDNLKSLKREVLIREAAFWVGTKETAGDNDGELIRMFQRFIGGAGKESWCMSFVQFCVNKVDCLLGNSVYAKLPVSEHCMTVWNSCPAECKSENPWPGRVAIWNLEGTAHGHCGIVENLIDSGSFHTIEGNTKDVEDVVRNGDGVYRRVRTTASSKKFILKGFIDPWS